jgi:hypothetical protein
VNDSVLFLRLCATWHWDGLRAWTPKISTLVFYEREVNSLFFVNFDSTYNSHQQLRIRPQGNPREREPAEPCGERSGPSIFSRALVSVLCCGREVRPIVVILLVLQGVGIFLTPGVEGDVAGTPPLSMAAGRVASGVRSPRDNFEHPSVVSPAFQSV